MKKLSSLFAALLCVCGLWAQTPQLVDTVWASYTDLSSDYPNYNDPDWGMVAGAQFKVEFYSNDSLVIRNWMNQNVDLCMTYDANGYILSVSNPGSTPSYWAYCDATYYLYFACQAYSSTNCWYSASTHEIYLLGSWGSTWDVNYHLSWDAAPAQPTLNALNTCANVKACYDAGVIADNDSVAVKGYIVNMFLKPGNFQKYGSVSIWLTDTLGGATKEFELYNCYGMNGDTLTYFGPNFTTSGTSNVDVDTVSCGSTLLIKGMYIEAIGKFKYYNGTYELNTGCYITKGAEAPVEPAQPIYTATITNDTSYIFKNEFTAQFLEYADSVVIKGFDGTEGHDLVCTWDTTGWNAINGEATPWVYVNAKTAGCAYYGAYLYTGNYVSGSWYVDTATKYFYVGGYFYKDDNTSDWGYINYTWDPVEETALTNVDAAKNVQKRIENGQLVIIKDGIRYNVLGNVVK